MVARGKALAHKAINEGKAVKIAGWEKEKENGHSSLDNPRYGEFLTGFLTRDKKNFLYLVKYGSIGTPYEQRKLYDNNSQKARGSRGDFLNEEEAREWMEDSDLDEGTLENLEDFIRAYKLIEGLSE